MAATAPSALIDVKGLRKDYVTSAGPFPALKGVDLRIDEGDFVAIMGASGSGKSTFMNILGCLDKPTGGCYCLNGEDVSDLDRDSLARVRNQTLGFVFQGFNLLPRMSLEDNVSLPLVYNKTGRTERRLHAREMLERVGLGRYARSLPSRISGGQQQRVAIARALINQPRLLLADEPTGNLDSTTSYEIMDLFSGLNRDGITIVLVTHETDIAQYARRQIHFKDGLVAHQTGSAAC
jgi:putative ABC transport system ATP-binding protein